MTISPEQQQRSDIAFACILSFMEPPTNGEAPTAEQLAAYEKWNSKPSVSYVVESYGDTGKWLNVTVNPFHRGRRFFLYDETLTTEFYAWMKTPIHEYRYGFVPYDVRLWQGIGYSDVTWQYADDLDRMIEYENYATMPLEKTLDPDVIAIGANKYPLCISDHNPIAIFRVSDPYAGRGTEAGLWETIEMSCECDGDGPDGPVRSWTYVPGRCDFENQETGESADEMLERCAVNDDKQLVCNRCGKPFVGRLEFE